MHITSPYSLTVIIDGFTFRRVWQLFVCFSLQPLRIWKMIYLKGLKIAETEAETHGRRHFLWVHGPLASLCVPPVSASKDFLFPLIQVLV